MHNKKSILVFTPHNPLRPFADELFELHRYNVRQNDEKLFDYVERECVLPTSMQKQGIYRGQNVIKNFNEVYEENKNDYIMICKWDDDLFLPDNILTECFKILNYDMFDGTGLYQTQYGAPFILMVHAKTEGWYGAFSRFYMYKMKVWDHIPVTVGGASGDPDNKFQKELDVKKHILDVPSIHLDHRCFEPYQYKVLLDLTSFCLFK